MSKPITPEGRTTFRHAVDLSKSEPHDVGRVVQYDG